MSIHQITPVDGDLADLFKRTFNSYFRNGMMNVDGCILPRYYKENAHAIENFEVRDDDVWVCGFPKTGTTWAQEMVWTIANDVDFEHEVSIDERFPLFPFSLLSGTTTFIRGNQAEAEPAHDLADTLSCIENMPSPRFIKAHLPFDLLPRQLSSGQKKPKVIYVCRNPKDTCISYYHYSKFVYGFEGSFEEYCTLFLGDTVYYGPFWKNVLSFWIKRDDSNILFLKYEDMKKDLPSVMKRTATFLGKNLTNDQVSLLTEHLSFSKMKVNPAVNREDYISWGRKKLLINQDGEFLRNGETGEWKIVMTPEVIKKFDDWSIEHSNGTGLSF